MRKNIFRADCSKNGRMLFHRTVIKRGDRGARADQQAPFPEQLFPFPLRLEPHIRGPKNLRPGSAKRRSLPTSTQADLTAALHDVVLPVQRTVPHRPSRPAQKTPGDEPGARVPTAGLRVLGVMTI